MSKRIVFKGQEILDLFAGLNQDENVARAYNTADRKAQVEAKEASLRANGQVSPIQLQEDGKGWYIPIAGLTRIAAAARIVDGYTVTPPEAKEGEAVTAPYLVPPQPEFTLDAIVFGADELTPLERSLRCIIDNQVEAPSDIDLGRSIQSLVKEHGLTLTACGEKLGISDPNKPGQCIKLLSLPEWFKDAIHAGLVASSVGLFYLKLKGEAKAAVKKALEAALEKGKSLTLKQATKIATEAEEAVEDEAEEGGEGGEGGGDDDEKDDAPVKLPIKEVETGIATLVADLKSATAACQTEAAIKRGEAAVKLFQSFDRWIHSKATYDTLVTNVLKTFDIE
jgi:hypothetical protein